MNRKLVIFVLILIVGLECFGNGVHYFLSGEAYRSNDLRNFAVVAQLIFAVAVIAYGIWYFKTPKHSE